MSFASQSPASTTHPVAPLGNQTSIGGATANDTAKYATYTRDSWSGLDHAMNRFYKNEWGRFTSPDPYQASGGVTDPESWNRYAYVGGDLVNFNDPSGLFVSSGGACVGTRVDGTCIWYFRDAYMPILPNPDGEGGGGGSACLDPNYLPLLSWECMPPPVFLLPIIADPGNKDEKKNPECFAQLKSRPVDHPDAARYKAVHTFWWIQDRTGTQYIISGGPTKANSSGTQYLNVSVTPGWDNGSGDNSSAHTAWSSGLSWLNCDRVDVMIRAANDWKANHNNTIQCRPIGVLGIGGPNSNSAARYLGAVSGFNPRPPTTAYGWWSPIVFP